MGDSQISFVYQHMLDHYLHSYALYHCKNVSIAGQCIKVKLLDEMHLHVSPILLGNGIPLFDQIGAEHIKLESEKKRL